MRKQRRALRDEKLPGAVTKLGRSYPTDFLWVPVEIEQDGQLLRWSGLQGFNGAEPGFRALRDFVELWKSPDRHILSFARQWGVLGLCKHGQPVTHNALTAGTVGINWCDPLRDSVSGQAEGAWEPLSLWREYSREALAILDCAIAASEGESVLWEEMDRAAYGMKGPIRDEWSPSAKVDAHPEWAVLGVNRWLELANVRPEVHCRINELGLPVYAIRYGGAANSAFSGAYHSQCFRLFGALAIELMQAISTETLPARCRGDCGGHYFQRTRRSQAYCQRCDETDAKSRMGQRRLYAKKKARGEGA